MKLNNKGFSVSGILYPLFLIMIVFVTLILLVLANSKFVLDKTKNEILTQMNGDSEFQKIYAIEVIYDNSKQYTNCENVQCTLDELYNIYE